MNRLFCLILVTLFAMSAASAASKVPIVDSDTVSADTLTIENISLSNDSLAVDTAVVAKRKGFFGKLGDYFKKSEHFNPNKKIDFGILGGPHYSSTTGVGLGIVASGLYRIDRNDPTLPLSNVSIFSNVTSKGLLMVGVRGNNVFARERFRFDYTTYIYTFPSTLWGIGYEKGNNDDNETDYSRLKFEAKPRFLVRLAPHTYIGPLFNVQYVNLTDFNEDVAKLMGSDERKFTTVGGGLSFTYDSRDIILNATRGWFVQLDQIFNPSWLGNKHVYHWTDLTVSTYHKAWRGAVIAGEFHSLFNYNDVPWPMLATVGGQSRMRGYFEGRYRDKNIVEAQIELRQHIKKRHGIVVWVGAANVFPKFSEMRLKQTLPNFGTGYRWRFKQGVNVRLDLGLTRNGMGFIFNINEAF